jgi:hypothetical protein
MKTGTFLKKILLSLFVMIPFIYSACSPGIKTISTPELYWEENKAGTVETNDIARLQKILPFTIILPDYLPDDLKSQPPKFITHEYQTTVYLDIYYYSVDPRELSIHENPSSIELPKGLLSSMHPDYTALEIKGVEIVFTDGIGNVVRDTREIQTNELIYSWNMNKISFSCSVLGFDQVESRKIIESMIK